MGNLLEEELFRKIKIKSKGKGKDIKIGLIEAMLITSGVESKTMINQEIENIKRFNGGFLKWIEKTPELNFDVGIPLLNRVLSFSSYMKRGKIISYKEGKNNLPEVINSILSYNPFRAVGDKLGFLEAWIVLCDLQGIKSASILSNGVEIQSHLKVSGQEYVINPIDSIFRVYNSSNETFVKYSKSSIISAILSARAQKEYGEERLEEALESCKKALIISPKYIDALNLEGDLYQELAFQHLDEREFYLEKVRANLEKVVKLQPRFGNSFFKLGEVIENLGCEKKDRATLEEAQLIFRQIFSLKGPSEGLKLKAHYRVKGIKNYIENKLC